jgi:hypothetical protein
MRTCSRPDCSDVATTTLTYGYKAKQATIERLTVVRDPHAYDLCGRHANALRVPMGWTLTDVRHEALAG